MSKMKEMFAVIAAAAMFCGSFSAMSVSATYDPCDVNQDGTVNMVDTLAISKHLSGVVYYTDYYLLDVNRSHTVDATDLNYITKKLLSGITPSTCYIRQHPNAKMDVVEMPPVSSTFVPDNAMNMTNDRWYVGYSYLEDEPIEPYKLTATTESVSTAQNPRAIVNGEDNRGVAHGYENTGIVLLNNGVTGFIVGDHQIATAAHCVYSIDTGYFADEIIQTYDRSGALVAGETLTVAEIHIPQSYYNSPNSDYDYALITVVEDLSDHVQFDIGNCYNMTVAEAGTIPIHVTGRPGRTGDDLENPNTNNLLYTSFGYVYEGPDTNYMDALYYTVDISAGQSGSPAYTITRERCNNEDTYTYTVLSICIGGSSTRASGPRMSKYHQQFYNNNAYANY